jgi:hypothetical protein
MAFLQPIDIMEDRVRPSFDTAVVAIDPPQPLPSYPPNNELEDHDRFSTSALCHELLHPIALGCGQ